MSTILQDMMGMLKRNGTVTPKSDNYITLARYPNPQERLKPAPKLQTELVTLSQLKTFFNAGAGGDKQQLSLAGQVLSLTNGGSVTLPDEYVNSAVFDGATDLLTLSRVSGGSVQIDMNRKDNKQYINYTLVEVATGTTVVLPDNSPGQIFLINNSGAAGVATLQLPSAANAEWQYRKFYITTNGTTTNVVTLSIDAAGSETINGGANLVINQEFDSISIWSDGSNWIILSNNS